MVSKSVTTTPPKPSLYTKKEYDRLSPKAQGYVAYLQSEQEGSELKGVTNHYIPGTAAHSAWTQGQREAVLFAQDMDD